MADYKQLYETKATNTGGRDGVSYLEDGSLEVKISTPKEMGGKGDGNNPEQLFALGYAACFNGALEAVKKQEGIDDPSTVTHTVRLFKRGNEPDFKLEVDIEVCIKGKSAKEAEELAIRTHEICPYSKAVDGNIDVFLQGAEYDATKLS